MSSKEQFKDCKIILKNNPDVEPGFLFYPIIQFFWQCGQR